MAKKNPFKEPAKGAPEAPQEGVNVTETVVVEGGGVPLGALPKFDPHKRRDDPRDEWSIEQSQKPIRGQSLSPEELRASIPEEGVKKLLEDAQRAQKSLYQQLDELDADEDLTLEAKARRAEELLQKDGRAIQALYQKARQKLEERALKQWEFSLPAPDGKTLATMAPVEDASEELAVQGRVNDILSRMATSKVPKGMKAGKNHRRQVLSQEYDAAMKGGGFDGRLRALAVIRVAEREGINLESIVASHRGKSHANALGDARRFEEALAATPTAKRLTRNPYKTGNQKRRAGNVGMYRSGNASPGGTPGKAEKLFGNKRRKPSWK